MNITLYFFTSHPENSKAIRKTHYYIDKEHALSCYNTAKEFTNEITPLYELHTTITQDLIKSLLNGHFNHCYLPGYNTAKSIQKETITWTNC